MKFRVGDVVKRVAATNDLGAPVGTISTVTRITRVYVYINWNDREFGCYPHTLIRTTDKNNQIYEDIIV